MLRKAIVGAAVFWGVGVDGFIRAPGPLKAPLDPSLAAECKCISRKALTTCAASIVQVPPSALLRDVPPAVQSEGPILSEQLGRLDELAGRGRYQEALGVLRSLQDGTELPSPLHFHKVVLACKQARQWALAMDLLREMRQKGLEVMLHTFGAVMDICASAGQLDMALQVAQWMEDAGTPLNRVAYTTLLKACAEAGDAKRAVEVLERLRGSPVSLDYLGYLKAVELLGSAALIDDAMEQLTMMEQDDTIVADYRIYFSLVRNALIHDRSDVAARAFEMMKEMGCAPPPSALKILWETLGKQGGNPVRALELFEHTHPMSPPLPPTIYHNIRLRLLLNADRRRDAMRQLQEMSKEEVSIMDPRMTGLALRKYTGPNTRECNAKEVMELVRALRAVGGKLDVIQYTMAMNHVGKRGALADARLLLQWMDEDGVQPNDVTFTTIIHLMGRSGDLEGAKSLLHSMESKGVPPSTISICALLNVYWKAGKSAEALEFFEGMADNGLPSDARVYAIVMHILISMGRAAEVPQYLQRMKRESIKPDERVYTILAKMHFANKDWRAAYGLLKRAEQEEIRLDTRFFTVLLDGLSQAGHLSKAWEVFHKMKNMGIEPNSYTYSALLKGYTEQYAASMEPARLHEYIKTFEAAVKSGLSFSIVNYNALIEACGRANNPEAALAYFGRLRSAGFKPDIISWTSLIKAHATASNFTGAFELLHVMRNEIQPTDRTFNPLIDRCARAGRMDLVEEVLQLMRSWGRKPDVVAFNSIVNAMLCRAEFTEAEAVLERMKEEGIKPSIVTFNILVDHYAKAGFWERAFGAIDRMKETGLEADTHTYNHLLDGLVRSGQFSRAEEVYATIVSKGLKLDAFTALSMLDMYSKMGDMGKFEEVVAMMKKNRIDPVAALVATIIRTYLQHHQPEKVMSLLEERRLDGLPVQRGWYMQVVSYLLEHDRAAEAFQYLDRLQQVKVRLDGRTYCMLARSLLNKGQPELVWTLWVDLRQRNVTPSADMAQLFLEAGEVGGKEETAREAVDELVKAGVLTAAAASSLTGKSADKGPEGSQESPRTARQSRSLAAA